DIAEPMADIAAKHEGIGSRLRILLLIGHEGSKGNGGKIDLFARHLVELRDRELYRVLDFLEVGRVGLLVPFKVMRVIDEVLHHEVFRIAEKGGNLLYLIKRGDRGAENVEDAKRDLILLCRIEEPNVAQHA